MKETRKSLAILAAKSKVVMLILKVEGKGSKGRRWLHFDPSCAAQGRHSPGPSFANLSFPENDNESHLPCVSFKETERINW